jgi:hypothetical protein
VVAAKDGAIKTLVLANTLPSSMNGVDLTVDLYIRKNLEITENRTGFAPLVNWSTSATEFCTRLGIVAYDSTWYNGMGQLLPMDVYKGDMFVQYRSLLQTYATYVHTISDVSLIISDIGPISTDNPLAMGVFKALSNSNGTDVKFMGVPTNDAAGYSYILQQCVGRNDVYGFVPLTWDRTIQNLVAAHVGGMSSAENGRWRIAWTNSEATEIAAIATENPDHSVCMATITDPLAGTNYPHVTWTDGQFLTDGVLPGDILRTNYQSDGFGNWTYEEYVVDVVIARIPSRCLRGRPRPSTSPSSSRSGVICRRTRLRPPTALSPAASAIAVCATCGPTGLAVPGRPWKATISARPSPVCVRVWPPSRVLPTWRSRASTTSRARRTSSAAPS